jgi:LPS sulfotransferase NodH
MTRRTTDDRLPSSRTIDDIQVIEAFLLHLDATLPRPSPYRDVLGQAIAAARSIKTRHQWHAAVEGMTRVAREVEQIDPRVRWPLDELARRPSAPPGEGG